MRNSFLCTLTLLLAGPLAHTEAQSWPEFRGPTGQGHSVGKAPLEWSETKNLTWKQEIPGAGWSSPAIVKGRIYLTSALPGMGEKKDENSLTTLCLDADTGKQVWQSVVFTQPAGQKVHAKNSHASPTPLIYDDKIYVHFGPQGTACLDTAGKILWKNTDLNYKPVHGNGGSPILVEKALIYSIDGSDKQCVVALDKTTGKLLWQTDRASKATNKFSFSTPLLIDVKGQKQVVSPGSDTVVAYDPVDGKEIWRCGYTGYSVVPRPVYGHGLVFMCTGYNPPATLLAIKPDGKGDVTGTHIAWQTKENVALTPSPLLVGDELYMISDRGAVSCLDAKSGKVHWSKSIGGNHSASPIVVGDRIYLLDERASTTVVKTGKEFVQLAKNSLEGKTLASLAVVSGALYLRTDKYLYRFEEK